MCGIVGYIGPREAQEVLLEGLRRLEYRGYDSAGIAVANQHGVQIARSEGKLGRLVDRVAKEPLKGPLGIGHTRWATHGRPSDTNAHPHSFKRVTIVHNGIIENHRALRAALGASGHTFHSETDSEILAHLVERSLHDGCDPLAALRASLSDVKGVYALCCVIEGFPDRFFCARRDVPLILGLGDGENFCASDIPAILHYTRNMVFLEDGDLVEVRADGVTIRDATDTLVVRAPRHITWSAVMAEKEGYKHFMLKEIFEQPRAIADTLRGRLLPHEHRVVLEGVQLDPARLHRIFLVACGTSYHACLVGKHLIESLTGISVEVDLGSEFRYRDPLIGPEDLLVVVSQSGETADTKAAEQQAKARGAAVLAIANVVDSSIPRLADMTLYTHAGPEIGVASTKAFTTQLVALHLFALYLAQEQGHAPDRVQADIQALMTVPHVLQAVLNQSEHIQQIATRYLEATDWLYLGRGLLHPIALEGALKLKEISYIHAEGYAAGEMKHGPIALIDENMPVVGLALQNLVYDKVVSNLEEVRARNGQLIAIATEGDTRVKDIAAVSILVPAVPYSVQPIVATVPLQLLAYYVADAKGTDVDQPRNLAKSVTVE